jgi:hypothetical protein
MKLNSMERVHAVTHAHDLALIICCDGRDLKAIGECLTFHEQGVVSSGLERIWEPLED